MGFTLLALTQSDLGLGQIGNDPELAASEGAASAGEQSLPPDTGPVVGTPVAQRVAPDDGVALSTAKYGKGNSATPADKSALAVAAPCYRSREHLRSVDKTTCLVCGHKPSDPDHLRYAEPRALGRKAASVRRG